jgi:lipoprotein signal peptidase
MMVLPEPPLSPATTTPGTLSLLACMVKIFIFYIWLIFTFGRMLDAATLQTIHGGGTG